MHNHVIAGDFGYLPIYSDDTGYTFKSDALDGLRDYVNSIVDSTEGPETADQYGSVEAYWMATGVVESIGTDGAKRTIQAVFNREVVSVDYAEITVCYEAECPRS